MVSMTEGEEQARARLFEQGQAQDFERWKKKKKQAEIHEHNLKVQAEMAHTQKPILQQVREHAQSPIMQQVQTQTQPAQQAQPSFLSKLIPAGKLVFSRLGEAGKRVGQGLEAGAQKVNTMGGGSPQMASGGQIVPQMRQTTAPAQQMPVQQAPAFDMDALERSFTGGGLLGMGAPVAQPMPPVMRVKSKLKSRPMRMPVQKPAPAFDMGAFEASLTGGFGSPMGQPMRRPARQRAQPMAQGFDIDSFEKSLTGGFGSPMGQPARYVRRKIRRHHTHKRRKR